MTPREAKELLESDLWDELISLTGEWIYTEWSKAPTAKERERLFAQLEGARVMDRVLRSQSTAGQQVMVDLSDHMKKKDK